MNIAINVDAGRARRFLETVNCALIQNAAGRKQAIGRGEGARGPIGAARGAVDLVSLSSKLPNGKIEPITPQGWKTAVKRVPPILAAMPVNDPRRAASDRIGAIIERIGSIKNVDLMAGGNNSGAPSDGGATSRVRQVEALFEIMGILNGWRFNATSRRYMKGPALVVMAPRNKSGNRQSIKAFDLLLRVCVSGQDMKQILEAHGWSAHASQRKDLRDITLDLLDKVAIETGR